MSQQNASYQHFAKQLVDMWQQQIAKSMTDERLVAQWVELMTHATKAGGTAHASKPDIRTTSDTGTPHPAFSPELANAAIIQLERRLATSEARIAELERELAGIRREQRYTTGKHNSAGKRNTGTGS